MEPKKPRSREKRITENSKGVHRRGNGLGSGPVGDPSAIPPNGEQPRERSSGRSGKINPVIILILLFVLGGGGIGTFLSGGNQDIPSQTISTSAPSQGSQISPADILGNLAGFSGNNNTSSGWDMEANLGRLDTSVSATARDRYTKIQGGGKDTVTIMIYMCGTDLESRSGMATSDLQEMAAASIGENVNVLVYTGGCTGWRNQVISKDVNQIYQVKGGNLVRLVENAGTSPMTEPENLTSFIQWCTKNFPANRNELIFWDHGGGSLSGYGYDEKFPHSGSMRLDGINQALKNAGTTFDFIGFDACLMATMETALTLSQYADYLIASEETEPGVGWYYTNWLTEFSKDTSKPTIEVGKQIVDDFIDVCAKTCRGQQTTLSVIDLAELEKDVPQKLTDFSKSISQMIQNKEYRTVSNARSDTREFAKSSGIDQVDLVHLAKNMGVPQREALVQAIRSAVKYNRTSDNMTNCYGISIYFPYKKVSAVDQAVATYQQIGMDQEYARCIQEFASLEVGGQVASGSSGSPLPSLLGSLGSGSGSLVNAETIAQLLGGFLSGNSNGISGLNSSNMGFLTGRGLDAQETVDFLVQNRFDETKLVWDFGGDNIPKLRLSDQQWELVQGLELNLFYDDGQGYIDLGLDNTFDFDESGALIGENDRTWLAINGQPVAYYHLDTVDDGETYSITGRVPALLNGERVDLILVFDNETPYGRIAGARYDYVQGETETIAKGLPELQDGDTLDFLCDYYAYDGTYQDSYLLGETMTVSGNMEISNVDVGEGKVKAAYRFTDIYHQSYWTPALEY